ncbi:condensation domain-containing protein, partial [Streptosporangium subroseum]|uniref:condensation domain-containing protein n=1 Tax=Streptosporangium subroseum TaxID=106412 RepID=UPI0034129934
MTATSRPEAGGQPRAIEDIYPLTALQQGMLFHSQLAPGSGMYWVQNALLIEGRLDLDAFVRAWELLFARHPVLRSTVVSEGVPAPLSVVSRSVPLPLEMLDWRDLDEADQTAAVEELIERDRARGADFDRQTLARIALIRLGEERHQLVLGYHHLVLDGWSVSILLSELVDAYHSYRTGTQPRLPHRRPFHDYVAWLGGRDEREAEAYWRERLRGIGAATSLGVDRHTGEQGYRTHRVRLSPEATAALTEVARRHRLTLNTVVQGAWALTLSTYSGDDDVVFGVTTSGRTEELDGVESMVGLLINTMPTRIRVDGDLPLAEWLSRLQADHVTARRYEHTPLLKVQAWSEVPAGRPLFNSLFVFENIPAGAPRDSRDVPPADDIRLSDNLSREQANYPLTVIASPGRQLTVSLTYDRGRFDVSAVERLSGHLVGLLGVVAADPGLRLSEVSSLGEEEWRRTVREWNATEAPVPAVGGVHELFVQRVAGCPEATAVVSGGMSLTYGELEVRANRLA